MVRIAVLLALGAAATFAADPWKDKKASDWNEKDAQRVLTNSPWAKTVGPDIDMLRTGGGDFGGGGMGRAGGPGADAGGGMGPPGGGMGGPGGGGMGGGRRGGGGMRPGGGGAEPPKITVRWESAAPVQEAFARLEDPEAGRIAEWAKDYYIVSMSGGRMMGGGGGRRGPEGQGERPAANSSRMQEFQQRLLQATALKIKGREPVAPVKVEMLRTVAGPRTVFLFPRTQSIAAGDREVSFESAIGPMMTVKAKFALRDMSYNGQLTL